MGNPPKKLIGVEYLDPVWREYTASLDGLTKEECQQAGVSPEACQTFVDILGTWEFIGQWANYGHGALTGGVQTYLREKGFSEEFLKRFGGPDGKRALEARVRWLADHAVTRWWRSDYEDIERFHMVEELGRIGPDAKAAVPALMEFLEDEDNGYFRKHAADALGKIGPAAQPAVPLLKRLIHQDPSWDIRIGAVTALGGIGAAAAESIPLLIDLLQSREGGLCMSAAVALGEMGPAAKVAIPALVVFHDEGEYHFCGDQSWLALQKIGAGDRSDIPVLIPLVKDSHPAVRKRAVMSLGNIGSDASSLPVLIEALHDSDAGVRSEAVLAVRKLERLTAEAISALIPLLDDPDRFLASDAWKTLNNLVERTEWAVIGLRLPAIQALEDASPKVRFWAIQALGKLEVQEAAPLLVRALADPNKEVRRECVRALGKIKSKDTIPALIEVLKDPDPEMRRAVVEAFWWAIMEGSLGSRGRSWVQEAAPFLIGNLVDPDQKVREKLVDILQSLNLSNMVISLEQTLIPALGHQDVEMRRFAVGLLGLLITQYDLDKKQLVPRLIRVLSDPDAEVRCKAVEVLGRTGHDASAAIPLLKEMADHDLDPGTRKAATEALRSIQGRQ